MEIEISGIEALFVLLLFCVAAFGMLLLTFEPTLYSNPLSPKLRRLGWTIRTIQIDAEFDSLFAAASQFESLEVASVNLNCFAFSVCNNDGDGNLVRGFVYRVTNGSRIQLQYPLGFMLLFGSACALAVYSVLNSGELGALGALSFAIPFLAIVGGILAVIYFEARQEAKLAIDYILSIADSMSNLHSD